jgi:hypothetical protein
MSLTSAELPRVELHREPAGGPLLMRPAVEVDALVKIDGLRLDAEDDPWPVGIVLGHGEAIRAHERMFAGSGGVRLRVCPAPDRTRSPQPLDAARALAPTSSRTPRGDRTCANLHTILQPAVKAGVGSPSHGRAARA